MTQSGSDAETTKVTFFSLVFCGGDFSSLVLRHRDGRGEGAGEVLHGQGEPGGSQEAKAASLTRGGQSRPPTRQGLSRWCCRQHR